MKFKVEFDGVSRIETKPPTHDDEEPVATFRSMGAAAAPHLEGVDCSSEEPTVSYGKLHAVGTAEVYPVESGWFLSARSAAVVGVAYLLGLTTACALRRG